MAEPELDTLIAANIGDLDAAARYINETLQPTIAKKIDDVWDGFQRANGWVGESGFDDCEPWLAPPDWRNSEASTEDDVACYFELGYAEGPAELEPEFWLASLVGAGTGTFGLRWIRDASSIRAWRKSVGQNPDLVAALRSRGFNYEEAKGSFFLPVRIEQTALVTALQYEAPEQALEPLEKALAVLVEAKPDFDALLAKTADTSAT